MSKGERRKAPKVSTDPVTVELVVPIEVDGAMVTEVTLRRPKVRDMRRLFRNGDDIGYSEIMELAQDLGELSPEAVDELDALDSQRIGEIVNEFLSAAGGKTQPEK